MFLLYIAEKQFYQLSKRIYQFLKPLDLGKKIRGKNSLPSRKLVNSKQNPSQPRINPTFHQKVRKTDGNVSPIWAFVPEPLLDAGNPHKIRGFGFFVGVADWCKIVWFGIKFV